jgi:hypothetical protein
MKKWMIFSLIVGAQTAFAALPPLVQSAKEIDALLHSEELYSSLSSGEVILQINHLQEEEGSAYEVVTNRSRLLVDCIYKESKNRCGPAMFELHFRKAEKS